MIEKTTLKINTFIKSFKNYFKADVFIVLYRVVVESYGSHVTLEKNLSPVCITV